MKHFLFIVPEGRLLPLQFADAIPVLASDNSFSGYRTETSLASGLPLWEVSTAVLALFACFLLYLFFRQKKRAVLQRYRSAEQLRLIRCLLDLCYTYRESPAVFLDKFKDKVNIRELKSYTLIDAPKKRFPAGGGLYLLYRAGRRREEGQRWCAAILLLPVAGGIIRNLQSTSCK